MVRATPNETSNAETNDVVRSLFLSSFVYGRFYKVIGLPAIYERED